jgi:hypothetical protein
VSHLKERKEKICLNCQAELIGRYCHACGQENLEPKETVWHLVQHFFNDVTHFDGKFFSTVGYLIKKPGFLSKEYMIGRRMSYLNPIRMYVFTSAIFFIILFSIQSPNKVMHVNETPEVKKGLPALLAQKTRLEKEFAAEKDEEDKADLGRNLKKLNLELAEIKKSYGDTTTRFFGKSDLNLLYAQSISDSLKTQGVPSNVQDKVDKAIRAQQQDGDGMSMFDLGRFKTVEQYDSSEKALPDSLRDGWFTRVMKHRLITIGEEYHKDKKSFKEHFAENFFHSFPKILFFSLPFFALILNILYFRHKQYYYVDHGIFTIHLYCANFILILAMMLLSKLSDLAPWGWLQVLTGFLIFGIWVYMLIYLYKAMRGFYKQGRAKTFLKYFITFFLAFIVNLIILLIFILISAITIH